MTMLKRSVIAGLAIAVPGMAAIAPGDVPEAHAACPPDVFYSLTSTPTKMAFHGIPIFKDGPGGTISVERGYSGSVSYQVTAGAETEAGAIFAKAKVSISASLTKTNTTSLTHTYSHNIRRGRYGHVKYVSWGRKVHWAKYRQTPRCGVELLGTGTIRFPSIQEGWYFWQTRR